MPGLNEAVTGAHDRGSGSPRWTRSILSSFTRRSAPVTLLGELGATRRVPAAPQKSKWSCTSPVQWLAVFLIVKLRQSLFSMRGKHADVAPDLFTAETPLGTYQGITEKLLSRTPASFRTVLVPRGSSKPEWLASS